LKEVVRDLIQSQKEMGEAQKRTEQQLEQLTTRVNDLAEAQERTEQRLEELAEAQKRTENSLQQLVKDHEKTRKQLAGISDTVGYTLEDRAYLGLPELLKKDYGITLTTPLKRGYLQSRDGKPIEVNILGEGTQNGTDVLIIGEAKSQLSKKHIDNFFRKKLKYLQDIHPNIFPLLVTYMISEPEVEAYARKKGCALYYSYQFLPLSFM
ncbi:MAG: chordopoxvirus fusion protein, partial [Calditrichaeota bacterium]